MYNKMTREAMLKRPLLKTSADSCAPNFAPTAPHATSHFTPAIPHTTPKKSAKQVLALLIDRYDRHEQMLKEYKTKMHSGGPDDQGPNRPDTRDPNREVMRQRLIPDAR